MSLSASVSRISLANTDFHRRSMIPPCKFLFQSWTAWLTTSSLFHQPPIPVLYADTLVNKILIESGLTNMR